MIKNDQLKAKNRWKELFRNPDTPQERRTDWKFFRVLIPIIIIDIWSLYLVNETFISNLAIVLILLAGGVLGVLVYEILGRIYLLPSFAVWLYGIVTGCSILFFLVLASNYYLKDRSVTVANVAIIKRGASNINSQTGGSCKSYAVVEHKGIKKKLLFSCRDVPRIYSAISVRLELSKGLWGYDVIRNKQLAN